MDIFDYDESHRAAADCGLIAGIDEAGRGPIAGPVVAAAVILPKGFKIPRLRDSKLVPEKERRELFIAVISSAIDFAVGIAHTEIIERINILNATKHAMSEAVKGLSESPALLLIDAVKLSSVGIKQVSLIKGESKSASIAAASIIAKYVRDCMMYHYHRIYPQYGFDRHKGYCTEEHMKNVALYGPCPIHRRGFNKVCNLELPF